MIKDILLSLPLNPSADTAIDYTLSLASTFNARVTGVAFAYGKMPVGLLGDERWVEGIEQLRKEAEDAAKAAIGRFERAAETVGVSIETRRIATTFSGTAEMFGRIARRFDLSIVRQVEPKTDSSDHLILQAALFDSGRPLLAVPIGQKGTAKFDRVMICWDGSRSAARALADSLPLLRRAKAIEIVTAGDSETIKSASAGAIADHLALHRLNAATKQISATGMNIPDRILSHAAETAPDLVVMGGYGHSRLREFVLGGATRATLAEMSIPTLMSH
jgi:nucleotide-binding universal stress UspA family protein